MARGFKSKYRCRNCNHTWAGKWICPKCGSDNTKCIRLGWDGAVKQFQVLAPVAEREGR
jgi:Zn finger protein HypA/HybF involved in hydrogenase expression